MKILFVILGGWISRMVGGGWPDLKIPAQWFYAMPYALIFIGTAWSFPAYIAAAVGKRTGHGQYIDMGYGVRQPEENDERLDCIVRFFFGVDRGGAYWRCAFGMVVTGLAVTLVPGILYATTVDPLSGLILALSGATKALAYMTGWAVFRAVRPTSLRLQRLFQPTVWGEVLTGLFGWGTIAWAL